MTCACKPPRKNNKIKQNILSLSHRRMAKLFISVPRDILGKYILFLFSFLFSDHFFTSFWVPCRLEILLSYLHFLPYSKVRIVGSIKGIYVLILITLKNRTVELLASTSFAFIGKARHLKLNTN